jgi:hypothetical protein
MSARPNPEATRPRPGVDVGRKEQGSSGTLSFGTGVAHFRGPDGASTEMYGEVGVTRSIDPRTEVKAGGRVGSQAKHVEATITRQLTPNLGVSVTGRAADEGRSGAEAAVELGLGHGVKAQVGAAQSGEDRSVDVKVTVPFGGEK